MSSNNMNRKQRRRMEKQLGISKQRKNFDRKTRFEIMYRNIQEGKKREEEMRDVVRRQKQGIEDETNSIQINELATNIAENEGIPYIDAVEKAKNELGG